MVNSEQQTNNEEKGREVGGDNDYNKSKPDSGGN
jgi:hypothetical protein